MENKLTKWVGSVLSDKNLSCKALVGDASARRYFRIQSGSNHYIAMISPHKREPLLPFVEVAQAWHDYGITVPELIATDLKLGFALLTDFGDAILQSKLTAQNVDSFYHKAAKALEKIQVAPQPAHYLYPMFDELHILGELNYFNEWCLGAFLGLEQKLYKKMLDNLYGQLVGYCQAQPQVVIHRDYHCRNIIVLPDNGAEEIGILDFQDAMIGPITYDWVSLTKDCYIQWPPEKIQLWLKYFYNTCQQQKVFDLPSFATFQLWFDMTGLQRHLKVLGIFSRLYVRDNKSGYLGDVPRIMDYIFDVCQRYEHLQDFQQWLKIILWPALEEAILTLSYPKVKGGY